MSRPRSYFVHSSRAEGGEYRVQVLDRRAVCECPGWTRFGHCRHERIALEMNENQEESRALVPIEVSPPVAVLPTRPEISIMGELARSVVNARGHAVPLSIDSPAKAFAIMLAGWEVGAKPMTALRHMFVVNGRTEPDAQLMMGIVKARDPSARFVFHTRSADLCDVELFRHGASIVRIAYGEAEAERAGLLKKGGPWTQYRADMMSWAAVKRVCRLGAPDLVNAISGVDVGEAGDMMDLLTEEIEGAGTQALPPEALVNEGDVIEGAAEQPTEKPGWTKKGRNAPPVQQSSPHDATPRRLYTAPAIDPEPEPEVDPQTGEILSAPTSEEAGTYPILKSNADLFNAGLKLGYKSKADILTALGYRSEMDIADRADDYKLLREMAGK